MKRPTITCGSLRVKESVPPGGRPYFAKRLWSAICRFTSLWNASKIETAASAADITAKALVVALVVFPIASSSSVTVRTLPSSPAISAIPLALSVIGPNESIDMMTPVSESIDIVAMAVL